MGKFLDRLLWTFSEVPGASDLHLTVEIRGTSARCGAHGAVAVRYGGRKFRRWVIPASGEVSAKEAGVEPVLQNVFLQVQQGMKLSCQQILEDLPQDRRIQLRKRGSVDFSYEVRGRRFRGNAYISGEGRYLTLAFRYLRDFRCDPKALNLPEYFLDFTKFPHGLVLVTGPTGSGKTTTLSLLLRHSIRTRPGHYVTIEDPIEYVFVGNEQAEVHQREVGKDTPDFATALRDVLRQDPDVILLGEMRDLETIRLALQAAETGHLVFSTLHTNTAPETVERIVGVFPGDEQNVIRMMLANTLKAVICQRLYSRRDGRGVVPVYEVRTGVLASWTTQRFSCAHSGPCSRW